MAGRGVFVRPSGIIPFEEIPPKKGTYMTSYDFAISGQHYLFDVQSFAHTILAAGGDAFSYALLDRTTQGVIDDVASGAAELGVIMQTSETESALNGALAEAGSWPSPRRSWPCRQATPS